MFSILVVVESDDSDGANLLLILGVIFGTVAGVGIIIGLTVLIAYLCKKKSGSNTDDVEV